MAAPTRRSVLASLAAALGAAGCVGRPGGEGSSGGAPGTQHSPTSPTGRPSPGGLTPGTNVPDPDHPVYLANQGAAPATVRVWVERVATGEMVFESTHDLDASAEIEVYNLERAEPEGVERFAVCGQVVGAVPTSSDRSPSTTPGAGQGTPDRGTACATVETSRCYGSVHVTAHGDAVDVIYAIC